MGDTVATCPNCLSLRAQLDAHAVELAERCDMVRELTEQLAELRAATVALRVSALSGDHENCIAITSGPLAGVDERCNACRRIDELLA